MVFLLGMAALAMDVGDVYLGSRQLQAATDAAALAGATALPYAGATTSTVPPPLICTARSRHPEIRMSYPNLQTLQC